MLLLLLLLLNYSVFYHRRCYRRSVIQNIDKEGVIKTESVVLLLVVVCKTQQKESTVKLTKEANKIK